MVNDVEQSEAWFFHTVGSGIRRSRTQMRTQIRGIHRLKPSGAYSAVFSFVHGYRKPSHSRDALVPAWIRCVHDVGSRTRPRTASARTPSRREIIVKHGFARAFCAPKMEYVLGDGRPCVSDSPAREILHCQNLQVPLWEAVDQRGWERRC